MKHWYESCLGSIFSTDEILTLEESSCDQCGDFHYYIGAYESEEEALKALEGEE